MDTTLETEIQALRQDIKSLKDVSSKGLTNGDRYQMIKLIEEQINPLEGKLQLLETEIIRQEGVDNKIYDNYQEMLKSMTELRNFKSELQEKIDTENEHNRTYANEQLQDFVTDTFKPFRDGVKSLEEQVNTMADTLDRNHDEIIKLDSKIDRHESQRKIDEIERMKQIDKNEAQRQMDESKRMQRMEEIESNRQIAEAERFSKIGKLFIAIAGLILTLITLNTYLEPTIHHLIHILLGI